MRCCFLIVVVVGLSLGTIARGATVADPDLRVQTWVRGLDNPTGMAFVDGGRALVLEKNTGRVQIVANRVVAGTALDLPVANNSERGLLGIALSPTFSSDNLVYLSYTASTVDGGQAYDNRVERYRWDAASATLTYDRKILVMPATPGPNHDGGKIAFGPDGKLYATIGDLNRDNANANVSGGTRIERSGAILRVNPSGTTVTSNPFYDARHIGTRDEAINDVFAYGVRNSYGIAFDPRSGFLWDTENGPDRMDEINRVSRGANSGWQSIMGPRSRNGGDTGALVSMGPAAHYEDPHLSWAEPVAPTDAYFMETRRLGGAYVHDLFVGTVLGDGVIYRFEMSPSRKTLGLFEGPLADGVADNSGSDLLAEQDDIVFGRDFGVVTDMIAGPGGMYVLSLTNDVMYRITTASAPNIAGAGAGAGAAGVSTVPEPPPIVLLVGAVAVILRRGTRRPHLVRGG
jgi:glucose/arabinose dehydrogenase